MSYTYFQDWLSKSFKPCCNVLCSDKAKEIIAKNNLTPSEFLRPFGDFRGKKFQFPLNEKDKEKEPISLNDLILDFYDSDSYSQIKQESILDYIDTMFAQNEPTWNLNSPLITKNRLEPVMNKIIVGQYCTPWFKEFEKTILECLNFDEYELYQQPLINVFIASIEEKAAVINDQLVKKIPKIIVDKRYDSSKESIIIILNDCKDKILKKEEIEKSKTRFSKFKNYFIFNWDINCPPFADKEEGEQKKISENFKKYFHRTDIYNSSNERYKDYMKKQYGKYINVEKYKKYREEFLHYFSDVFLKKISEKIINPLNDIIKKNTGFSNLFKKNAISYYRNTNIYRFTELERSYYNLGVLYFYFHNYDLSNENLKLLKNTLKEKSDKHKDRIKELKAMSKFLQKKIAKKEFNILEEVKLNGNVFQTIRQELVILKMFENKLEEEKKLKEENESKEENKSKDEKKFNSILFTKVIDKFLNHNIKEFGKDNKAMQLFNTLLEEKLAVYNLLENKFRKYTFYMAITGKLFHKLEMFNYALYCLSKLLYFIDNPSPSFIRLRMYCNQLLGDSCNSMKYDEGSFKFYKNSFEFSCINIDNPIDKQNQYLQYYISMFTQIKLDKSNYNNIDLNELNIPQVDNASLFVLENDDYDIKVRAEEMENSKEKSWLVFNKYAESLTTDIYASLDEIDLNHIKLIHDLTNDTNKQITNVHTDRYFHGNINQKLFVKCAIRNPLGIEILVSGIKLYCSFIPNKKSLVNTNVNKSSQKISELNKDKKGKGSLENEIKNKEKEAQLGDKEIKDEHSKNKEKENEIKEESKKIENEEKNEKENNNEINYIEKEKNINETQISEKLENKKEINEEEKKNEGKTKIENLDQEKEVNLIIDKKEKEEKEEKQKEKENKIEIEKPSNEIFDKESKEILIENKVLKEDNNGIYNKKIEENNNNEIINKKEEKNKETNNISDERKNKEEEIKNNDNREQDKEIKEEKENNIILNEDKKVREKTDENNIDSNTEMNIEKKEENTINKYIKYDENINDLNEENKNINKDNIKNNELLRKENDENNKNEDFIKNNEPLGEEKNKNNNNEDDIKNNDTSNEEDNKNINKDDINNNETSVKEINENSIKDENKNNEKELIDNEETLKIEIDSDNKEKELNINDFEILNYEESNDKKDEMNDKEKHLNEKEITTETKTEKENNENEKETEIEKIKEENEQKEEKNNNIPAKNEENKNQEKDIKENKESEVIENDIKELDIKEKKDNNNEQIKNQGEIEPKKGESEIKINNDNENKDNQQINTNNINNNDNKENMKITRTSLERNFKIDSHTESQQTEDNDTKAQNVSDSQNQGPTPNPQKNEIITSSNSISSKSEIQNYQNFLSCSTCEKSLKPGEVVELELNVSSSQEGKIIVKGLEFNLFSQCKIIHLFSKKTSPSLYYYINRKKMFTMGGASHISSSSSSDYESRNSSELAAKNLTLNNIIIPRKNKIEYIVSDFKNDLYVSFPLGTKVNAFLYQLFFFPILIKNNSPIFRVRRYTIFIEDCDKTKIKSFINFITRDNKIKQRGSEDMIFIPIIPMTTGKLYLKILIKFISDLRQQPIQVKRYLLKLKVRESISFEVKEYCSNIKVDKDGNTYNKIDFNIKTNLRIRNEKEIKDLQIKDPLYNKDLNLINQKNYLINNNEIHKKYVFDKETNYSKNTPNNINEMKFNFDFISEIIKTFFSKIKENKYENNSYDTSYILNKFKKILNNTNSNTIFFPWKATYTKNEENKKKNEDSSGTNSETEKEIFEENEIILYGLYPYKLKMKNSETTKTFLSFLFNKFTDLKISTKKIDKDKTLIKMILKLNKIGLASMGDKIEKYEIYASGTPKPITWIGPKKYVVKNNLEETVFNCRFNFITTLKGNVEVNRISVLVFKKSDNLREKYSVININHITKPTSIFIE